MKVTLMGLGLLGRGVGDAKFFAETGAELIVTDLKTEAELAPSIEKLRAFKNITYHLGGHRMEDFENRDLIIKANNAPLDSPFIAHARAKGIPVEMDAAFFAKQTNAMIIGITGTRGKSTVTHLIYEILRAAGKYPHLGGNERDVATLSLLHKVGAGDLVVLELDSWQLQGFAEDKISPHVAVWTNFMPDHMNYYKGDMDRYFEDKAAIARFQKSGDYFVTTPEIKEKIEARFGTLAAQCITDAALPADWTVGLPGAHNRANAAFATAAARRLGVSDDVIKKVLKSFKALPNRLELLGEKGGIAYYNDGNATTPEATIAALITLAALHRPIVLIAGGSDKELEFSELAQVIAANVKKAVLFEGKATEKLKKFLPANFPIAMAAGMDAAFMAAREAAAAGGIVLLSPAATSFGLFANEYDRGDQFRALFEKL